PAEIRKTLGPPVQGELVSLHNSDRLTVLKILWTPGMTLYPHDHRMWATIGIYGGREDNAFFKREGDRIASAGERSIEDGDTILLGADVIHSVHNPRQVFTEAIHVYGGDFFGTARSEWDPASLAERAFDIDRARAVFAEANEVLAASRGVPR